MSNVLVKNVTKYLQKNVSLYPALFDQPPAYFHKIAQAFPQQAPPPAPASMDPMAQQQPPMETGTPQPNMELGQGQETSNLMSEIFGDQQYVSPLNPDIKNSIQIALGQIKDITIKLAKELYNLDISEEDAMKVVKESLKNLSSRIADVPIAEFIDRIDDYLDNNKKVKEHKPSQGNTPPNTKNTVPNGPIPQANVNELQPMPNAPANAAPAEEGTPKMSSQIRKKTKPW